MDSSENKRIIIENLTIQNNFYYPEKAPGKDMDFQFEFNEPGGFFQFYFSIQEKSS